MKNLYSVTATFEQGDSCCTFRWANNEAECESEFRLARPTTTYFSCKLQPSYLRLNTIEVRKQLIGQYGLLGELVSAGHPKLAEITTILFKLTDDLQAVDNLLKQTSND